MTMTNRERFHAIMSYEPVDRLPVWYFGLWGKTWGQWKEEAGADEFNVPEATGMDPDWESGMWNIHGLTRIGAIPDGEREVLEDNEDNLLVRTPLGAVHRHSKLGSSIPEHVEEALKPTRESWERFKIMLDPSDPRRIIDGWEAKADAMKDRTEPICFLVGSLYGWLREWMGVEAISYLPYDDPELYEEMIATVAEHFMAVLEPVLQRVDLDFGYYFEDCCFNTGPLISPAIYQKFFHKHYKRMIEFYKDNGVGFILLDSDGKVDTLLPYWLESGVDIMFPIEVGTWKADPVDLRNRFGRRLRMMGGVNKHVIPEGKDAIRAHLEALKPAADEGGYIPLPDHRIPPNCSLDRFRTYVETFKEVFA